MTPLATARPPATPTASFSADPATAPADPAAPPSWAAPAEPFAGPRRWPGPGAVAEAGGPGTGSAAAAAAADPRTSRVRPYTLTGGRTSSGRMLLVETFVATIERPDEPSAPAASVRTGGHGRTERYVPELREIVELCRHVRSLAEVSALLRIPLGVVRVLISDLADQGRIRVYGTGHGPGGPDRALLERVLSGLRRL